MPIGKEYVPFGRYVLVERLAAGGMAEVFLARERSSARTVVVKRMLASVNANPDARARFLDESRIATLMEHPNIVRVLDVGLHEGSYFMAMEWLLGWELREIIDRCRQRRTLLPLPVVVKLVLDACRGLAFAHSLQSDDGTALDLVHRDISPRNLFVTADGVLKVLDFGLAKSSLQQRRRTNANVVMGTYGYIAPEQIEGGIVDQRTDVFALGAVLHELITGEPLFVRGAADQMLVAMLTGPIPAPVRPGDELDGSLVAIVMRMLQRKQDVRYQSAALVEAALEAWLAGAGAPTEQTIAELMTSLFQGSEMHAASTSVEARTTPDPKTHAHVAVSRWADDIVVPKDDGPPRQTADIGRAEPATARPKKGRVVALGGLLVAAAIAGGLDLQWRTGGLGTRWGAAERTGAEATGGEAMPNADTPMAGKPSADPATAAVPNTDSPMAEKPSTDPATAAMPNTDTPMTEKPSADPAAAAVPNTDTPMTEKPSADPAAAAVPNSTGAKPTTAPWSPPPAATKAAHPTRPPKKPTRAQRRASARAAAPAAPAKPPAPAIVKTGRLTLDARPWANVYLGDKLLGATPLVERELPAGRTQLRLIDPVSGAEQLVTVDIPEGGDVRRVIKR